LIASLKRDFSPSAIIYCVISAVLVTITVYHYGSGNHAVIIPFLKDTLNPALYPNDYFVAQSEYYHTFLWDVFAVILNTTGLTVEWLFFIGYLVCLMASAIAVFGIAVTLFKDPKVGYLSVFIQLVYFIHNAGVGDEFLMDHLLKESQVALPFLLFAIYSFLNKSYQTSYFLLGLGFLIHALSSIYVIVFLSVPLLVYAYQSRDWKALVIPMLILFCVSIPLLIRKSQHSPETMHMFEIYLDWVVMLKTRYPGHSFPFSWSIWKYVKAALVVGLFIYTWKFRLSDQLHSVVKYGTFTVFACWILGIVFTELIPLPIFIQLQLFRSYTLISLFAVIYWSNYFMLTMEGQDSILVKGLVLLATVALIIMLPSEGNPIINKITDSPGILWKNNYLFIILFGLILLGLHMIFKAKLSVKHCPLLLLGLMAVMATRKVMKEGLQISSHLPKPWVEVQHWAKLNTQEADFFIVPPQMRGFRIDAERSIMGDYKDGIQMYFNPDFGYQWQERMALFGVNAPINEQSLGKRYHSLEKADVERMADIFSAEHPSVYFISTNLDTSFGYPNLYSNKEFIVYKVR
jgi:hypothetical protein